MYLAVVTALFSLPNVFSGSALKSSIQTYLLLAFIGAIGLSQIANHWLGGALKAWLTFLPSAAVYFFIVANVTTASKAEDRRACFRRRVSRPGRRGILRLLRRLSRRHLRIEHAFRIRARPSSTFFASVASASCMIPTTFLKC